MISKTNSHGFSYIEFTALQSTVSVYYSTYIEIQMYILYIYIFIHSFIYFSPPGMLLGFMSKKILPQDHLLFVLTKRQNVPCDIRSVQSLEPLEITASSSMLLVPSLWSCYEWGTTYCFGNTEAERFLTALSIINWLSCQCRTLFKLVCL